MRVSQLLKNRLAVGFGLAAAIVGFDLWTKKIAAENFAGNPVEVLGDFFGFTYVENTGGAFSLFPNGGQVIGAAAIVVAVIVVVAILRQDRPVLELVALGLVLGGAIGNLVDRVARGDGVLDGPVIDWIILWKIPTFNIADAAVSVAVGLLLIQTWRTR